MDERTELLSKSKEELVEIIQQIKRERVAEKEKYGSARILVDQMFQMAALISLDDRILDANGPCLVGIGKTLDQVKGMHAYECQWWNFEGGPEVYKSLSSQCQATKKLARTECTLAAGDGGNTNIYVDCSMMPVLDENGEMTHMIGEARDITERKLAEDQVKQKTEELEQLYQKIKELDKMKSNFIANVSHELRTPLALICGPADILIEKHDAEHGDEETGKLLHTIRANSYVLLKHVNALLNISRLEAGKLHVNYEYLELDTLAERLCSMFEIITEERKIKFDRDFVPVTIQADSEKIESVLLNLLSNAFKFTPENGRISVKIDINEQDTIQIDIADSGPGVPLQFREMIFQRFRQIEENATRTHGGIGLGLAIASELMEAHGGKITVSDSEYGGALFRVSFPRYATGEDQKKSSENPSQKDHHGTDPQPKNEHNLQDHIGDSVKQTLFELQENLNSSISRKGHSKLTSDMTFSAPSFGPTTNSNGKSTVLVVEDNISMNNFICSLLQNDYNVISAVDGEEGLDKIMKEKPACVVCDIMMPKVSGDQLVAQVRKNVELNSMPILILTAKIDSKIKVDLLRVGAQDCIAKPFESEDLLARVRNLVSMGEAWRALQRAHREQNKNLNELIDDLRTLFNNGVGLETGLFRFDNKN